jgi:hypothetical protein
MLNKPCLISRGFRPSVDRSPSFSQPGRPARPDPGGRPLLRPVFPHQIGTHRNLGQPQFHKGSDFILRSGLTDDLVDLVFLAAPLGSVLACVTNYLNVHDRDREGRRVFGSFGRARGEPGSFQGWPAVALRPAIVLGENVKDPVAATAVGVI